MISASFLSSLRGDCKLIRSSFQIVNDSFVYLMPIPISVQSKSYSKLNPFHWSEVCTLSALCGCAVCVFIIYCVCCVATAAVSSQPQHQHCLPLVLGQSERRKRATDQSQPGIYRQLLYTQHSGVVTFTHLQCYSTQSK